MQIQTSDIAARRLQWARHTILVGALGILVGSAASPQARESQTKVSRERAQRLIAAYDPNAKPLPRLSYSSPDGAYLVKVKDDECSTMRLLLYARFVRGDRSSSVRRGPPAQRVSTILHQVNSFMWLPGHPHTLVAATSGDCGAGMLALWNGGRHFRNLRPVKDPSLEWFELDGATPDGKTIFFEQSPLDGPTDKELDRMLRAQNIEAIPRLRREGHSVKTISYWTGLDPATVRKYLSRTTATRHARGTRRPSNFDRLWSRPITRRMKVPGG